uniref:Uncharacterized protein n=1 Tax=Parascaris equorum TaxID=6256 RepID=A0A914RZC1_PAREQ
SITRSYYRNSVGVIVVYDISNRATFEHVAQWLNEAEVNVGGPQPGQCVFQLVGHKADLNADRQEAFTMVAREINARVESGALRLV